MQTLAATRRYWRPQLLIILILALIGTLPFWLTDLDTRVAALFYHPGAEDPWFESHRTLWLFLYQAAPVLIALVTLGSLAALAAGALSDRYRRFRLPALFLIATAALGPGLAVNSVFKDHWGRPRPHQTVELGGAQAYLPPLAMGEAGKGKSFPSGHSSAGFLFTAFFLIWRRRRPCLAALALAGSILLGTLLGIARMSAGDHFLSDVIWSAVIVYGLAVVLYYFILRVPQREDAAALAATAQVGPATAPRPMRKTSAAASAGYALAGTALLSGVLMVTPMHNNRSRVIVSTDYQPPPRTLRLVADHAQISVSWHLWLDRSALFVLKGRGFGLPGTRVRDRLEVKDGVLTYRIDHRGFFTEKDTSLRVGLAPFDWDRVEIETATGDVLVYAATAQLPEVIVKTGDGKVQRDVPPPEMLATQ